MNRSRAPSSVVLSIVLLPLAAWAEGPPKAPDPFKQNPWERVKTPTAGPAEAVGFYSDGEAGKEGGGCLRGAVKLPLSGPGFEVMRPSRNRFWGHPVLIDFIEKFSRNVSAGGLGSLLIGDMALPRGGPLNGSHASHQNGLDADIWYRRITDGKAPTKRQRKRTWGAPSLVRNDSDGFYQALSDRWDPQVMRVLELAASDARVQRIFVSPVIKKEICRGHAGQAWVQKLRPWWGHVDHFHVRLRCPPNEPCVSQPDEPADDGCAKDLDAWFTPERRAEFIHNKQTPSVRLFPQLPAACASVLSWQKSF